MPQARRAYRVLAIAPTSFFGDYGCHVRILEEINALRALGTEVTVCTYKNGRDLPGVDIRRTLPIPGRTGIKVGSSRSKPFFDALLLMRSLEVALRLRPQIIHGHLHEGALIGLIVSRILNVPLVFDFQGSLTSEMMDHGFISPQSRLFRPLHLAERLIDKWSDVVITSTSHGASLLTQSFGISPERIHSLPDAVNTDVFVPRWTVDPGTKRAHKSRLGIPADRKLVVYLGLLAEYQGASHLLEAAQMMLRKRDDLHFLLMGYPGEERYRSLAEHLGIASHVSFTGRLPYELAPSHLALGDVAVSPKVSQTEGNGKLLNYMAVGLPTVAFDTPVNREILGGAGLYARLSDSTDLARKIEEALDDELLNDRIGQTLRERAVQQFSWLQSGERILDVYDGLLRRSEKGDSRQNSRGIAK